MKLVIGAGERLTEGWTHHDVKPYPGIDIVCDLFDLPFHVTPGTCTDISMTHVLEHFSNADVPRVLALIHDLLEPEGHLYLELPNFAWHAELVLNGEDEKAVYYAFGGQLDAWDFHKTGFTPRIALKRLQEAGFSKIEIEGYSTLTIRCQK